MPERLVPDTPPLTALLYKATLPPLLSMSPWNSDISLRTRRSLSASIWELNISDMGKSCSTSQCLLRHTQRCVQIPSQSLTLQCCTVESVSLDEIGHGQTCGCR